MLVPVIVDLAENHWHKILQESLIALKTILKEIDPFAFDEAVKMTNAQAKRFKVKQDEDERKGYDERWAQLNKKLVKA
jgi:serine/threonine-protein phosphatase 2A regulatory subunit B'